MKLRYEVKPRPKHEQEEGQTHMVVDNKKQKAVRFGTKGDCEVDAYARNDGGVVA